MICEGELVTGRYYRLTSHSLSRCTGTVLRVYKPGCGRVVWTSNTMSFVGDEWGFMVSDMFEELTEEEATLYKLAQ